MVGHACASVPNSNSGVNIPSAFDVVGSVRAAEPCARDLDDDHRLMPLPLEGRPLDGVKRCGTGGVEAWDEVPEKDCVPAVKQLNSMGFPVMGRWARKRPEAGHQNASHASNSPL